MKLKNKDLLLMSYFRNNARENLTKISRQTQIPVSTIFQRLREFEKGPIQKHTTLLDFRQLGFDLRLNMMIAITKENKETCKQYLIKNDHVNSLYKINNGFDYMIECIFKNMSELQRFLDIIEKYGILQKLEVFILEDIKREEFLTKTLQAEMLEA
jgi:Lrp/AsnC family transcriptional regulator, leucine-responsive regulatory protein